MKFRKNDAVIVTTGSDRGKTGTIEKILKVGKIVIEGVNKRIKHVKGKNGEPGQRIEFFAPIHISNIAIQDPKTGKAAKIGYKKEAGEKVRISRASGEILPKNTKAVAKKAAPKKTTKKK